jgi:hypothetical protein
LCVVVGERLALGGRGASSCHAPHPTPPLSPTPHPPPLLSPQGAILVLGRDLVMVPKLIHPVPPSTPRTPDSSAALADEEPPTPHPLTDTWMTQVRASCRRCGMAPLPPPATAAGCGTLLLFPAAELQPPPPPPLPPPPTFGRPPPHWSTQVNEERPPTPPRGRPHQPGSSLEYF